MVGLTREDGQTLVGYALALAPFAIIPTFVLAVLVLIR